jgi:acyl CoA:acetate/3-ketoacid CoA transferase beta subunit
MRSGCLRRGEPSSLPALKVVELAPGVTRDELRGKTGVQLH